MRNCAGLAGLAAMAGGAASTQPAAATAQANPFAYDVSRLSKTDPKLVAYEQVARIRSSRDGARRLAVGPDDRLYVGAGKYVTVLGKDGGPLSEIALADPVRCLALTGDGDLLVGYRDQVEIYDPKGQRRAFWKAPGARAWLTGLACSKEAVFVADAGNRIVLHCDFKGQLLARIGEKNKERNIPGFIVPSPFFDLELHPDGLLRVANPGRHRVDAYTTSGDFEFAWGKPSAAIEGFCGCCNPINFAVLKDGRIVTCEKGLPRVKIYSAEGQFESVVAGPELFPENAKAAADSFSDGTHAGLDVAADSAGRIYVLDQVKGDIRIMARKPPEAVPTRTAS